MTRVFVCDADVAGGVAWLTIETVADHEQGTHVAMTIINELVRKPDRQYSSCVILPPTYRSGCERV